jgi:oligopeptide transport system substrate-binding protein
MRSAECGIEGSRASSIPLNSPLRIPHSALRIRFRLSAVPRPPTMALPHGISVDPLFQVLSMVRIARKVFPFIVLFLALAALSWAISFGTLPRADFSFNNEDEVKTIDPAKATGNPDGRIIDAVFEGLYRVYPEGLVLDADGTILETPVAGPDGTVPTKPIPATAESCEISPDGKVYTFQIRKTARWSDGTPVTARDFRWSWRRMLHPETASRYGYQLHYVVGAKQYNEGTVSAGDRVEVELGDRPNPIQPFPRGTIERGVLRQIVKPPEPSFPAETSDEDREQAMADWRETWIYMVEIKPTEDSEPQWESEGTLRGFCKEPEEHQHDQFPELDDPLAKCVQVLSDFDSEVGVKTRDDATLVVRLNNPTPFFLHLVSFYPLYPVNQRCIETHGVPDWTRAENIVGNGPFRLQFRRIRDRFRLAKNADYWNARSVKLEIIDAMAVKSATTGLNMYLNGQLDWAIKPPDTMVQELRDRDDFIVAPSLITYFYRLNVNRPPLDDVHVRRALNLAIDKRLICEKVMRAGQQPARHLVPPGLAGYVSPQSGDFDPAAARAELAKSKYAQNGQPFPNFEILYNTLESHRSVAEVIQQQWKNNLGINAEMKNLEWATYLDATHQMEYTVARAGWIGDYPDPNTFLDMWVTDGGNNETGWSNPEYDELIADAQRAPDPQQRLKILNKAEQLLMSELPIIPIYFYVMPHMLNPHVAGFYLNAEDRHPLHLIRLTD